MNEVEEDAKWAWLKSKRFIGMLIHHAVVLVASIFGIVLSPTSAGIIIPAAIGAFTTVTATHAIAQTAQNRAEAYSPNFPLPPGATASAALQSATSQPEAPAVVSSPLPQETGSGMRL